MVGREALMHRMTAGMRDNWHQGFVIFWHEVFSLDTIQVTLPETSLWDPAYCRTPGLLCCIFPQSRSPQKLPLQRLLIQRLTLRIRCKGQENRRHVYNLGCREDELRHDPIADVASRHAVPVPLLLPPPDLLKCQYSLQSLPVYGQRKGNVLVLDLQEALERLDTACALLVLVGCARTTMFYKVLLYLGNAAVGENGGGVVFYRHRIEFLFRIPYTLLILCATTHCRHCEASVLPIRDQGFDMRPGRRPLLGLCVSPPFP